MEAGEDLERGPRDKDSTASNSNATDHPPVTEKVEQKDPHDWTSRFAKPPNVEVLEFHTDSNRWHNAPDDTLDNPSRFIAPVLIRLFLVEGLGPGTIEYFSKHFPKMDRGFFQCHALNVLPYNSNTPDQDLFFGKWSRAALQEHDQWHIEDRINKGKPYNRDGITDPKTIGLNHDRYERATDVDRPCSSLEADASDNKEVFRLAIQECVSICYKRIGDSLVGKSLGFSIDFSS